MAYRLLKDRRAAVQRWKKRNPDKVRMQQVRYRERVGRRVLAKRLRDWKKKNPDRVAEYKRRQRRGYYGT